MLRVALMVLKVAELVDLDLYPRAQWASRARSLLSIFELCLKNLEVDTQKKALSQNLGAKRWAQIRYIVTRGREAWLDARHE